MKSAVRYEVVTQGFSASALCLRGPRGSELSRAQGLLLGLFKETDIFIGIYIYILADHGGRAV